MAGLWPLDLSLPGQLSVQDNEHPCQGLSLGRGRSSPGTQLLCTRTKPNSPASEQLVSGEHAPVPKKPAPEDVLALSACLHPDHCAPQAGRARAPLS